MRNRRAYTLVELLLCLAMIAILATLLISSMLAGRRDAGNIPPPASKVGAENPPWVRYESSPPPVRAEVADNPDADPGEWVTRKDFEALRMRVEDLERRLTRLER